MSLNKKIIILVIAIVLIISGLVFFRDYIKPYSVTGGTPGASTAAENIPVSANEIEIINFTFNPHTIVVSAGTKVVWKHNDAVTHVVVADDGSFRSQDMNRGDEFSFTFSAPGTFGYHCAVHPSMMGTVIVK